MSLAAGGRLVAPLIVAVVLAAAAPAGAAPVPFLHDLDQVNGHLRVAVEYAPEELGESLGTAEVVCGLGERATSDLEPDLAAADWATLGQLVDRLAVGATWRVEVAFANSDSVLLSLRERYERRWAGRGEDLRQLRLGTRATRRGIAIMRRALAALEAPFGSWRAHECAAATDGVEAAFADVPSGLELINVGMLRLWRLAESRVRAAGAG